MTVKNVTRRKRKQYKNTSISHGLKIKILTKSAFIDIKVLFSKFWNGVFETKWDETLKA